jgi:hypothetical protein
MLWRLPGERLSLASAHHLASFTMAPGQLKPLGEVETRVFEELKAF